MSLEDAAHGLAVNVELPRYLVDRSSVPVGRDHLASLGFLELLRSALPCTVRGRWQRIVCLRQLLEQRLQSSSLATGVRQGLRKAHESDHRGRRVCVFPGPAIFIGGRPPSPPVWGLRSHAPLCGAGVRVSGCQVHKIKWLLTCTTGSAAICFPPGGRGRELLSVRSRPSARSPRVISPPSSMSAPALWRRTAVTARCMSLPGGAAVGPLGALSISGCADGWRVGVTMAATVGSSARGVLRRLRWPERPVLEWRPPPGCRRPGRRGVRQGRRAVSACGRCLLTAEFNFASHESFRITQFPPMV